MTAKRLITIQDLYKQGYSYFHRDSVKLLLHRIQELENGYSNISLCCDTYYHSENDEHHEKCPIPGLNK